jgi:hypothetical protein
MFDNVITPEGVKSLEFALNMIAGRLELLPQGGAPSEAAGVICGPLAAATNVSEVFEELARKFFIRFGIATSESMEEYAHDAYVVTGGMSTKIRHQVLVWAEFDDRVCVMYRPQRGVSKCWDTGYSASDIHAMILQHYQDRKRTHGPGLSCNPINLTEVKAVLHDLTEALRADVPEWLKEVRASDPYLGRHFVGASRNGGTLNLAVRATGYSKFSTNQLKEVIYQKYVGTTDAWLAKSYPEPHLVLPRIILAAAILTAMEATRIIYLPEVAATHGVLMDPQFYSESQRNVLESRPQDYAPMHFTVPWAVRGGKHNPHVDPRLPGPKMQNNFRPMTSLDN